MSANDFLADIWRGSIAKQNPCSFPDFIVPSEPVIFPITVSQPDSEKHLGNVFSHYVLIHTVLNQDCQQFI
jgi:hypothetical protein